MEDQDPYMPLSTIDRGGRGGSMGMGTMGGPPIYQRSRTIHTPPQTPPYHGTLNGHGVGGQGTYGQIGAMAVSGGMAGGMSGGMPQNKNNGIAMDSKPLPGPPQIHAGIG